MRLSGPVLARVLVPLSFLLLVMLAIAGGSSHQFLEGDEEALAQLPLPSVRSTAELARWMEAREERHLPVPEYLESLLWRWSLRAYPSGNVPLSAYRVGAAHRERMPAAHTTGRTADLRSNALPQSWQFVGPRAYAVHQQQTYNGVGTISGRVNGVAYDPAHPGTYWLASGAGGAWKSTDSGQSWSFTSRSWPALLSSCVAVDPSGTVYVGTGDYDGGFDFGTFGYSGFGIMKSADGGSTWQSVAQNDFGPVMVSRILIDPENPQILTAATGRGIGSTSAGTPTFLGRVWRSIDGGNSWTPVVTTGADWSDVKAGIPDHSGQRYYYATGEGVLHGLIYRSADRGATWQPISTPVIDGTFRAHGLRIAPSAIDPATVFLLDGQDAVIWKSTNAGNTWTDTTDNFPFNQGNNYSNWAQWYYDDHIECAAGTQSGQPVDLIFVGLVDLDESTDGGNTWQSIGLTFTSNAVEHADQHAFQVNPANPNEALVGNDGGISRLHFNASGGALVFDSHLNDNLGLTQFYTADFHPTDASRMLGGVQDNGTAASLRDLTNWQSEQGGDGAGCALNPANPSIQYASAEFQEGILHTTDGWATSSDITPGIYPDRAAFTGPITLDPSNPNLMYIGTNYVWQWNESQHSWTPRLGNQELAPPSSNSDTRAAILSLAVAPTSGQTIYAGTNRGQLWVTLNTGSTWTRIDSGSPNSLPNSAYTSILVDPANPHRIWVTSGALGQPHLWRCDDVTAATRMWVNASGSGTTGLPDIYTASVTLDPADGISTLFVATDLGVFRSVDGGQTWQNFTSSVGLPNVEVGIVKMVPGTGLLMAGTYGTGMWEIDPHAGLQRLQLTSPNGGNSLAAAQSTNITWTSTNVAATSVKIDLSRDGGATFPETLAAAAPNSGSFAWVPALPATSTARIRITAVGATGINSTSAANFSITAASGGKITPPKSVTVGTQATSTPISKAVSLTNQDKLHPLVVTVLPVATPFGLAAGPTTFSIPPRKSQVVTVTYSVSTSRTSSTGALHLLTTDPAHGSVSITLKAKRK